jgi:hypothetical protein
MNAIRQAISVNLFVSLSDRSGSDPYIHRTQPLWRFPQLRHIEAASGLSMIIEISNQL